MNALEFGIPPIGGVSSSASRRTAQPASNATATQLLSAVRLKVENVICGPPGARPLGRLRGRLTPSLRDIAAAASEGRGGSAGAVRTLT
jgi:hypothetical protein